jgi:hypothetical protein
VRSKPVGDEPDKENSLPTNYDYDIARQSSLEVSNKCITDRDIRHKCYWAILEFVPQGSSTSPSTLYYGLLTCDLSTPNVAAIATTGTAFYKLLIEIKTVSSPCPYYERRRPSAYYERLGVKRSRSGADALSYRSKNRPEGKSGDQRHHLWQATMLSTVKMPGSAVALILIVVPKPNRAFSTTMQQKFNYFEPQVYKGQVLWVI